MTRTVDPPEVVEYCANNLGDRAAFDDVAAEARCYPCMERCDRCRRTAFVVADGRVLTGDSHRELARRLGGDG